MLFLFLVACSPVSPDSDPGKEDLPPIATELVSGTLFVPAGATLSVDDLMVETLAGSTGIEADGTYSVEVVAEQERQLQFISSRSTDNVVLIGFYDGQTGELRADVESTALALLRLNPLMIAVPDSRLDEFTDAAVTTQAFRQLVDSLEAAYARDAEVALDEFENPDTFRLALEALIETFVLLQDGEAGAATIETASLNVAPFIENIAGGPRIRFVNPRHAFYAAGIEPLGDTGGSSVSVLLERKEKIAQGLEFSFNWPPVVIVSDPAETTYNLGDGYYRIELTKGDFRRAVDVPALVAALRAPTTSEPEALATLHNMAALLEFLFDLIGGSEVFKETLLVWPEYLELSAAHIYSLTSAVGTSDWLGIIEALATIATDNTERLGQLLQDKVGAGARAKFLKKGMGLVKSLSATLKVYGISNELAPYVLDLLIAPSTTYYLTQRNGDIVISDVDLPPVAEFTVSPPSGVVGTVFELDASASHDDRPRNQLQYRWDFDGDGVFDTAWSGDPLTSHAFDAAGSYLTALEVKDAAGQIGLTTHRINVGGGGESATHVVLFRDNLPWDSDATVQVLHSLGFSADAGTYTYELVPSSAMSTHPLRPGQDLVFISNDQHQQFYDNYARSHLRFATFVMNGGTMFWGASDLGWANGSMEAAGVVLPGNVQVNHYYSDWNYVTDTSLPLVAGLPEAMDHNYASHENFSNLPDGATVYLVDDLAGPTLIEFSQGLGWVLMSGLPLEHQYVHVYGNNDLEQLLPRIIAYVVGVEHQPAGLRVTGQDLKQPERPSSGSRP